MTTSLPIAVALNSVDKFNGIFRDVAAAANARTLSPSRSRQQTRHRNPISRSASNYPRNSAASATATDASASAGPWRLDLLDALAGYWELLANLFTRVVCIHTDTEARGQSLLCDGAEGLPNCRSHSDFIPTIGHGSP